MLEIILMLLGSGAVALLPIAFWGRHRWVCHPYWDNLLVAACRTALTVPSTVTTVKCLCRYSARAAGADDSTRGSRRSVYAWTSECPHRLQLPPAIGDTDRILVNPAASRGRDLWGALVHASGLLRAGSPGDRKYPS